MLNEINKFFKNGKNLEQVQWGAILGIFGILLFGDLSRTGLFGWSYIVAIILIVLGVVLIIIPEPMTTMTGIGMAAGGLLLIFGTAYLQSLMNKYGIWFWVVIGAALFLFMKFRGRRY